MKFKKIISVIAALSVFPMAGAAFADETASPELFNKVYDMTDAKADGENGIIFEEEVPDGDYTVTIKTGGKTATSANIYINGGERVRAYTLEPNELQENEQPVVPKDGKITVQVLGENPNLTEIDIKQLPNRTAPGEKVRLFIAGDSTAQTYNYTKVYPQTGWGQVFGEYFTDEVEVVNRSMGGRSSKSYNNDGRLDKILTEMNPGDYVFIQFGINDGAVEKPERYISVEDYTKLITDKYIGEVVKRGGTPVLMTASAASWWDEENGVFSESRADYADPTREIAKNTGVAFIDANRIETDAWNAMDKYDVLSGYYICEPLESKAYPAGTDDHTHLKAKGAKTMASLIAGAIPECVPELTKYLKADSVFNDIANHWAENTIISLAKNHIVDGIGEGKFAPEASVTRAEFLKMAMDACGVVGHAYREGECLDATENDWFCYYLQGALDKDLIPESMIADCKTEAVTKTLAEATEDKEAVTVDVNVYTGSFNAGKEITREEMAVIAVNCMSYALKNSNKEIAANADKTAAFTDSDIYEGYVNAIDSAYAYGLIDGIEDTYFGPKLTSTRAQAATVVERLMKIFE